MGGRILPRDEPLSEIWLRMVPLMIYRLSLLLHSNLLPFELGKVSCIATNQSGSNERFRRKIVICLSSQTAI